MITTLSSEPRRSALILAAQVGLPNSKERTAAIAAEVKKMRKEIPSFFVHEIRDKGNKLTGYNPESYAEQVATWAAERRAREAKMLRYCMEAFNA